MSSTALRARARARVCVCPSRMFRHTFHSTFLRHMPLFNSVVCYFSAFLYIEVRRSEMLDHFTTKLMMLQNMIIESKDFRIWTQYFIQHFIFFRWTLLCINNSAIDIWKFFVNILCTETYILRESTLRLSALHSSLLNLNKRILDATATLLKPEIMAYLILST